MIRRLFYLALGAILGVLAMRKLTAMAQRFGPQGLAAQANDAGDRVGRWWQEVRSGAAAREAELRTALGLPESDTGRMTSSDDKDSDTR